MDNQFNIYDVVKIITSFYLQKSDNEILFPANIVGVIVEAFSNEYLIEFEYSDNDTYYVLVKEKDLERVWKFSDASNNSLD